MRNHTFNRMTGSGIMDNYPPPLEFLGVFAMNDDRIKLPIFDEKRKFYLLTLSLNNILVY